MSNEVYTLEPATIRFDDKYVVFNPMHSTEQYESTKANIQLLGQLDPILMLNGVCIDGRHRVRIAKELGILVKCVDVDPTLDEETIIVLCNKNVMSGRDYDNAQKAIQALLLTTTHNIKSKNAAVYMKIDKKMVAYAATIRGYGRSDILDTLLKDRYAKVQLGNMERPSRSLEIIAKYVKAEAEEKTIVVNDSERIHWKPDALIKTEHGKAWYYEQLRLIELLGVNVLGPLLVELANLKYTTETVDE